MNFLAHAWLARGGNDAFLYGNLIADGVKGPHLSDWPADVARGIRHHRLVDATIDSHPVLLAARARAPREGRRYAGIALDILWDHFIARQHADTALVRRCYRVLEAQPAPQRLVSMIPALIDEDWLTGYADFGFTCQAVAGVGQRLSGPNRLAALVPWLEDDYAALERDFHRLWPDLLDQLGV
ncbi:acyl carrier protein phosphodiesterase [Modicisalibacter muralis]|uniref:acyl carrier protein phosphodiesterase n=1 Tax=Modicisalibacter muralis TaxID=119000 RepID=UPI000B7FE9F4|nr:ACP phosphodiesterase [Halomonas muralis]